MDQVENSASGATALVRAAARGHVEIARCLLMEFGADADKARGDGLHLGQVFLSGPRFGARVRLPE